ncbi:YcgN family cysteine cluster protein [Methylosoma difficile]
MSFWKTKTLGEMSTTEWESLCDNCGKCCLHKLEDEDTGKIAFTSLACELLDLASCRCTRYSERTALIPDCLDLQKPGFREFHWLPSTCAYRLLSEGKDLPDWHPLVTGKSDSTATAGMSVSGFAMTAEADDDPEDYVIDGLN